MGARRMGESFMYEAPTCPNCRGNIYEYKNSKTDETLDASAFTTESRLVIATDDDFLSAYANDPQIGLDMHMRFISQFGSGDSYLTYIMLEEEMDKMRDKIKTRKAERSKKIMELDEDSTVPEELETEMRNDNKALDGIMEARKSISLKIKDAHDLQQFINLSEKVMKMIQEMEREKEVVRNMKFENSVLRSIFVPPLKRKMDELTSLKKEYDEMKQKMSTNSFYRPELF